VLIIFQCMIWLEMNKVQCQKAQSRTTCHCPGPRNSEVCLLPAKWCLCYFGTIMAPSLSITRIVDRRSVVHGIVLCLKRNWNSQFPVNTGECWQMELFRSLQCLTSYGSRNHWNDLKTKIWASPPRNIHSKYFPIWLPYFWTAQRCITQMLICKW